MGFSRIYPRVDSRLYPGVDPGGSQNLPVPPRIYPPFRDFLKCLRIPECTPPSQNISRFQQIYMCDPPRIYPSLPEYTPFSTIISDPPRIYLSLPEYPPPPFNKCMCATFPESTPPSQNILPFSTTTCDPSRIYLSLPEYTPLFNK